MSSTLLLKLTIVDATVLSNSQHPTFVVIWTMYIGLLTDRTTSLAFKVWHCACTWCCTCCEQFLTTKDVYLFTSNVDTSLVTIKGVCYPQGWHQWQLTTKGLCLPSRLTAEFILSRTCELWCNRLMMITRVGFLPAEICFCQTCSLDRIKVVKTTTRGTKLDLPYIMMQTLYHTRDSLTSA